MAGRADMTGVDRRTLIGSGLLAAATPAAALTDDAPAWPPGEAIPLWPGLPPGGAAAPPRPRLEIRGVPGHRELQLRGVDRPCVYPFRPARPNGVGLLICPGGGYEFLAVENEGLNVAKALTGLGYTIFLLVYRLPGEGWRDRADAPLQDAQRAIRLIRRDARRHALDPSRVGVLGFSAGGHLAASLATGWRETVYPPLDEADAQPARPAFAGLIYAVTTLELPDTHVGSRTELLGGAPSDASVRRRSPVLHVDRATPPSFLLHALDDTVVPPACTRVWLDACVSSDVPVDARFIAWGGHGFGVGLPPGSAGSDWPSRFHAWQGSLGARPVAGA